MVPRPSRLNEALRDAPELIPSAIQWLLRAPPSLNVARFLPPAALGLSYSFAGADS